MVPTRRIQIQTSDSRYWLNYLQRPQAPSHSHLAQAEFQDNPPRRLRRDVEELPHHLADTNIFATTDSTSFDNVDGVQRPFPFPLHRHPKGGRPIVLIDFDRQGCNQ